MKATTARTPTIGFGYPIDGWPHYYTVIISHGRLDPVVLTEDDESAGLVGERFCKRVGRATWDAVADRLEAELNVRLKAANLAPGRWKVGVNRLGRTLGKEVELLLMTLGEQDLEDVPVVLANWRGLEPAARWWLHRKASASGAWREAVRIGLAENPVD